MALCGCHLLVTPHGPQSPRGDVWEGEGRPGPQEHGWDRGSIRVPCQVAPDSLASLREHRDLGSDTQGLPPRLSDPHRGSTLSQS